MGRGVCVTLDVSVYGSRIGSSEVTQISTLSFSLSVLISSTVQWVGKVPSSLFCHED